jgi:hypothetical protein
MNFFGDGYGSFGAAATPCLVKKDSLISGLIPDIISASEPTHIRLKLIVSMNLYQTPTKS